VLGLPGPCRVPSTWSLTTSTVSSALELQVYCALLPALRFAAFPVAWPRYDPKVSRTPDAFLATRFIPFKGFPSSAAVPLSHATRRSRFTSGLCLLVVTILARTPSIDAPIFRRRPPRQCPKACSLQPKPNFPDPVETLYRGDGAFQPTPCGMYRSTPPRRIANFKALLRERIRCDLPPLPAPDPRSSHGLRPLPRSIDYRACPESRAPLSPPAS